jgi:outer membrane protein
MRFHTLALALSLAITLPAQAATLSDIFRDALAYDAQFASAKAAYAAEQERRPQARAGLLPNVSASANIRYTRSESTLPNADYSFDSNGVSFSAVQPLYRKGARIQVEQADMQVQIAEKQLALAEQDLILRVAQAYFDVLEAQDNMAFIAAQKAAITEQLASAKRNFEVGTATITDTHEAQARFDLATAQEIAEQNQLAVRQRTLERLIGKPLEPLAPLQPQAQLPSSTGNIDDWAGRANQANLQVLIQRLSEAVAQQEIFRNRADFLPTVDAVAALNVNNGQNFGSVQVDTRNASVGVEVNLPLYQGGLTTSRVRQAVANRERARQDAENATREAGLSARQAYLNVASGLAQARALEQALVSSQAQLDSTELGLQVGVRTSLDVLNAQQQVLSAKRDLASARYSTLLAGLALEAAVGTLDSEDLVVIDALLRP